MASLLQAIEESQSGELLTLRQLESPSMKDRANADGHAKFKVWTNTPVDTAFLRFASGPSIVSIECLSSEPPY